MQAAAIKLQQDSKDFWSSSSIPRVDSITPQEFLVEYVNQNKPVVLTGEAAQCHTMPAMEKWQDLEYLRTQLSGVTIPVNFTPNGRADAITDVHDMGDDDLPPEVFMKPEERNVSFDEFLENMLVRPEGQVAYLSAQNDCLREVFRPL